MRKEKEQTEIDPVSASQFFSDEPRCTICFANTIDVRIGNEGMTFSVKPEDFEDEEVSVCFWKNKRMNSAGRKLRKEYGITASDCDKPGIDMKLAFQYAAKHFKEKPINRLGFFGLPVVPDMKKWQQDTIDHGVPKNFYVRYLDITIPPGYEPRVHERLNYDHLSFFQTYSKEERIFHTVNEKMLRTKLLILCCFISNPEVLARFEGWGLIVDFAEDNKIDKLFIEDVINKWIGGKEVRRLTGLYDRRLYLDEHGNAVFGGSIMSKDEVTAIVQKLIIASRCVETENLDSRRIKYRFTRKDGTQADLYISYSEINCIGISFIQTPHEDIRQLIYSGYW